MTDRVPLEKTTIPGIYRRRGKRGTTYTVVCAIGSDARGNPIQTRETFATFAAAKAWRTRTLHSLASRAYVEPSTERAGAYLARWVEDQRGRVKPATICVYRQHIARLESLADLRLCDLDPPTIAAAVTSLHDAGYAPSTITKTYRVLKLALADAARHDLLAVNPCDRMRGPTGTAGDPEHFTEGELARFRTAAKGDRYEVLWETAIETGMRFAELTALRWANVDLAGRVIRVTENVTRTEDNRRTVGAVKMRASGEGRAIGISDDLARLLGEHRTELADRKRWVPDWNPDDRVFPGERSPMMNNSWINACLAHVCRQAGVKVVTMHALRHTSATAQIEAGIPVATVAQRLGHVDPAFTLRMYVHPDSGAHARAADLFGAHLRRRERTRDEAAD